MKKALIASALVLSSQAAVAATPMNTMSNFSYDYMDVRIGLSPLTYGAGFTKSIHPNAHITGRIDTEFDHDWDAALGVGFHAPINNWADLTGEILARSSKSPLTNDDDKFGVEVNIGVRQWLGPQLEVGGNLGHLSIDNKNKVIGSVYARFHSTELFSVGVEGRFNDAYDDQAIFTTRFKF
ncbi:hypothetical protein [Vibrio stylophorae]|uniref:hypothetical protein n=1 Tax=Vibrio stylophorae TaxID=659351 RepID=UPI001F205081|nr:hypothetical protein [Vibrio stylophorae]